MSRHRDVILDALQRVRAATVRALCRQTGFSPSLVFRTLMELVGSGRVERSALGRHGWVFRAREWR